MEKLTNDTRISTLHLALYVAILQCREEQGGGDTVILPKDLVMLRSRIREISAYYKGLKELDQYGVLRYWSRKSGGGEEPGDFERGRTYYNQSIPGCLNQD